MISPQLRAIKRRMKNCSPRKSQSQILECGKPNFTWQGEPHLPYVRLLNGSGLLKPFYLPSQQLVPQTSGPKV
jgi:hypothetical protein